MNTGQMLLVIGALAIFATIALSVNRRLRDSDEVSVETQTGIVAVSLGQSKLEEAGATGFEALPIGVTVESVVTDLAAFSCTTRVDYVQDSAPDVAVAGPTPLKRVLVTVVSEYMSDPVVLRSLVGEY